ncbi:TetR/AcrR family transcriptional regulator [Streptomyces coacervatus]|uniref:TetR/AcrR family transcriptional regulator n=2 Tax=Streptomyces coacervatus TaxID=647381 RepID=A0ABP7JR04_9ACTN
MAGQDRRVRRTRRTLHDALIELVLERAYERITVQDILDRADVGRSTFYAHFRDKDALLVAGFDEMREELRRELDAMSPSTPPSDPARPAAIIFEHAYRHQRVYLALCGRQGGNLVYRHLHRLIGDLAREHLRPHLAAAGTELPAEVVAEFYTSSVLALLAWWVDQGFPRDPDWLARAHQTLAVPGLLAALGQPGPAPAAHP